MAHSTVRDLADKTQLAIVGAEGVAGRATLAAVAEQRFAESVVTTLSAEAVWPLCRTDTQWLVILQTDTTFAVRTSLVAREDRAGCDAFAAETLLTHAFAVVGAGLAVFDTRHLLAGCTIFVTALELGALVAAGAVDGRFARAGADIFAVDADAVPTRAFAGLRATLACLFVAKLETSAAAAGEIKASEPGLALAVALAWLHAARLVAASCAQATVALAAALTSLPIGFLRRSLEASAAAAAELIAFVVGGTFGVAGARL